MTLTNAHTHLELGWLDSHRPGVTGDTFTHWIVEVVSAAGRNLGDQRYITGQRAAEAGIQTLIDCGTTSVGDISISGVSIEPLLASGLSGVVYLEVIAVNPEQGEFRMKQAQDLIEKWRKHERNGMRLGFSLHATYSVIPEYWKRGLEYAQKEDLPLCIHAAESDEELDFFLRGVGPIADHNRSWHMDFPTPGITPIAFLEDVGALALKPLLIHTVQVNEADIARIKAYDCPVVHCPRSNLRLRCGRMPLEQFLAAGVSVYMGTDSLGSSPSLNVMDEVEVAVGLHWGKVAPGEIEALAHKPLL